MQSKFKMLAYKTVATPLVPSEKLKKEVEIKKANAGIYRSWIGSLLYLIATRPDIIFL